MLRSPVRSLIMAATLCSLLSTIYYNINYILMVHANQTPQLPGVKIISQIQNQQVPAGTLSITGVSTDNSTTDCDVYVILNEVRPYQRVNPSGNNTIGENRNYSTWNYTFTPDYATIQEGNNRMVAKITCNDQLSINNENLTKFNSLNVTGIRTVDNAVNSELQVPSLPEPSINMTYSDLVQLQDRDSNNTNSDKAVSNPNQSQDTNTQIDEQDEGDDTKDFIEELHERVLDQVREQLRKSGIDVSE
jgi:hypothetical protein